MQSDTNNTKLTLEPALLSEKEAGRMLGCSGRTIRRLADAGKAPRPLKLGHSTKWRRVDLEAWIAAGCPRVRIVRGGAK